MNIPEIILKKVKVAMKLEESEFNAYLEELEKEGKTYVTSFFLDENVRKSVKDLCVDLYIQYNLFSKIEYEQIAEDKLHRLHHIIETHNMNYEKRTPIVPKGVTFL